MKKLAGGENMAGVGRRILLVDDHPLCRKAMTQLLDSQPDLEVRTEAETSGDALNAIRSKTFDLAVVDVGLHGGPNGIELTKMLKVERPDMPVLIVSMHDEVLYAERSLRAGARGYLMKRETPDFILHAVRSILQGEIYISPAMTKDALRPHPRQRGSAQRPREPNGSRVGNLSANRRRPRDASDRRTTASEQKTVEAHRANIKEKLGVISTQAVASLATQWLAQQR